MTSNPMQSILQDIVAHTNKLGFLNIVKITGTEAKTLIDSMADDRSVIMYAETANPHPDMIGTFGMPQLEKLRYLVDGKEYQEDAKIEVVTGQRNGEEIPVGLHFENKDGDFKNDYRFMNQDIINEKLKTVKFRGVNWHVEVAPTVASVQRFQFQAGANTEHTTFLAKTDGDKLIFTFGDAASHGGEFVFATGVTGKITKAWTWPVMPVLSILKIADANNAKIGFSNDGAMQIELDSGIATYKYIIPAQA
jgi:hypothetical protein